MFNCLFKRFLGNYVGLLKIILQIMFSDYTSIKRLTRLTQWLQLDLDRNRLPPAFSHLFSCTLLSTVMWNKMKTCNVRSLHGIVLWLAIKHWDNSTLASTNLKAINMILANILTSSTVKPFTDSINLTNFNLIINMTLTCTQSEHFSWSSRIVVFFFVLLTNSKVLKTPIFRCQNLNNCMRSTINTCVMADGSWCGPLSAKLI